MTSYESSQIRRVLDAGPASSDAFFRLQIHGAASTKTLSVTPSAVRMIGMVIDPDSEFWRLIDEAEADDPVRMLVLDVTPPESTT